MRNVAKSCLVDRPDSLTYASIYEWLRRVVCLALDSHPSLIPRSAMSPNANPISQVSPSEDSLLLESPPASPSRDLYDPASPTSPFSTERSLSGGSLDSPSRPARKYQDDDFRFWTDSSGKRTVRQAKRIAYAVEEILGIRLKPEVILEYANVRALTRRILRSLWRKREASSKGNPATSTNRTRTARTKRRGSSDLTLAKSPFR